MGKPLTHLDYIGNENAVSLIVNAIKRNSLENFLLLIGETGVGKSTLAKIVAKTIVCTDRNKIDDMPCYKCVNCNKVEEETEDIYIKINIPEVTSKSDAEDVFRDVFKLTKISDKVVYVFEEMDKMPDLLQRQMLEYLTKIPKDVYIIGCKTNDYDMIPSFKSRPDIVYLEKPNLKEAQTMIYQWSMEKGIRLEPAAVDKFIKLCDFNPRTMFNGLRFISENNALTLDSLRKKFGIVEDDLILKFLTLVFEETDFYVRVKEFTELFTTVKPKQLVSQAMDKIYEHICCVCTGEENKSIYGNFLKDFDRKDIANVYSSLLSQEIRERDSKQACISKLLLVSKVDKLPVAIEQEKFPQPVTVTKEEKKHKKIQQEDLTDLEILESLEKRIDTPVAADRVGETHEFC